MNSKLAWKRGLNQGKVVVLNYMIKEKKRFHDITFLDQKKISVLEMIKPTYEWLACVDVVVDWWMIVSSECTNTQLYFDWLVIRPNLNCVTKPYS